MNAKDILMRAVECDKHGRILEARNLYEEGIQILMDVVAVETDAAKKKCFGERIKEYIDRAEQIKVRVQKHSETGDVIANIPIDNDSTGNSYNSLFGKYLDANVREILLDEPYLIERYQFHNLIAFFELAVKKCKKLKYIHMVTKPDRKNPDVQGSIIAQIRDDLKRREVALSIKFEPSLHDRKIVLSNGYIIKIGRGLHFFKPVSAAFSLGVSDYDFRKCLQTDVNIWRTKNFS